jgi:hypothetical protein
VASHVSGDVDVAAVVDDDHLAEHGGGRAVDDAVLRGRFDRSVLGAKFFRDAFSFVELGSQKLIQNL